MIAAAAAAMVGGAYATTGCCDDVGNDPAAECNAYVYSLTINVKGPFATKSVKKNGCTGYYLDNGSRTINGYMWTCCNPCEDQVNGGEAWQMTLWDKTAKTALLNGVSANGGTEEWTASYEWVVAGLGKESVTSDKFPTKVAARADLNAKVAAIDAGHAIDDAKVTFAGEKTGKAEWVDYTLAGFDFRYGKTANNYTAWGIIPVEAADIDGNYDANIGTLTSIGLYGGLNFVMTGAWNAKEYRPKSLSGTVMGEMNSVINCNDFGDIAAACDDFETWCDYALNIQYFVPVTGTIKAAYVSKLKTSLRNTVPAYDRN